MDADERKFLIAVWLTLGGPYKSSSAAVWDLVERQGLGRWTVMEWLRAWEDAGWWSRGQDRLALATGGHFTDKGALEVGYQTAVLLKERGLPDSPPPPEPPAAAPPVLPGGGA